MKRFWILVVLSALLALCGCGKTAQVEESLPPQQETSAGFALAGDTGDLVVSVGDVTLRYPAMWEDRLTVQKEEDSAAFFATIDDQAPVQLFEIAFGREDNVIGKIGDKTVSVIPNEPEFDDTWSADEISAFHAMQEDVNYILEQLAADYGFAFS